MNKLVCIDSHIVIWGIKNDSEPEQVHMIELAREFLRQLDDKEIDVLIPSIVIGESLVRAPDEKHPVYLKIFYDNFVVGEYTGEVASVYARIMRKKIDEIKRRASSEKLDIGKIKFDIAIAATAIYYGAACIYTYDTDLSIVKDMIEIREIPPVYTQQAFEYAGSAPRRTI